MGSTRQVTLLESWRGGRGAPVDPDNLGYGVRGGRGRGQGKAGTTRGRGRGGGRRSTTAAVGKTNESTFEYDDDDLLCEQALSNFELVTNDISKAFEEVNTAKDLPGFDKTAGDIWIYPTNRPVRDYQFNIVQTSLYHNTMVCLPTGLGKTFIAAVVMYNFHRWYPNDIIVFMAPTKPLVTQQLEACHELMGIDPSKMVELTGNTPPKKREDLWSGKKVFFLTPQVMTSDLSRGSCLSEQVRCIVVDEAHKALGNHAYAQVISMVSQKNKCFRVLALSATPGNDIAAVQAVLRNLLISRVELRSETSLDILPYTHQKQMETVVVPLDNHINSVHTQVMEIFQVYTGKLMKLNVLFGRDGSSFTQFQLLKARDQYRLNPPPGIQKYQRGSIEVDYTTCITLAHALDLLLVHGLRSFYSFLHGVMCKEKGTPAVAAELKRSTKVEEILGDVQSKLNISQENSFFDISTSGLFTTFSKPHNTSLPEPVNPDDYLLSHPKMRVLRDIVGKHFQNNLSGTRIMIFSQYRDSVQEIGNMLSGLRPLVKPMVFVGQAKGIGAAGRGLRQKEQVQVLQGFRSGDFNVLVSTCVGEEGLDIGEVDLIICFDASRSPTRLVQRMGRTGRKRQGKIIFLLAQGREQRLYYSSLSHQSSISKNITDSSKLEPFLYKESPRMVPQGLVPQCYKMDILLSSEQRAVSKGRSDSSDVEEIDDFSKPKLKVKVKIKLPKKQTSSKKSSSSAGSNDTVGSNNPDNLSSIKRCFENMQQRKGNTNGGTAGLPLIQEDDDVLLVAMDSLNVSFSRIESEVEATGTDFQKYLKELIGIKEVNSTTFSKCVFVPKLPNTVSRIPNFDGLDLKNLLPEVTKNFDVECLREKLNAVYMLGPSSNRCDCGIVFVDNEMLDFDGYDVVEDDVDIWVNNKVDVVGTSTSFQGEKQSVPPVGSHTDEMGSEEDFDRNIFGADEFEDGFIMDENDPFFNEEASTSITSILIQKSVQSRIHPNNEKDIKETTAKMTDTSGQNEQQFSEQEKIISCSHPILQVVEILPNKEDDGSTTEFEEEDDSPPKSPILAIRSRVFKTPSPPKKDFSETEFEESPNDEEMSPVLNFQSQRFKTSSPIDGNGPFLDEGSRSPIIRRIRPSCTTGPITHPSFCIFGRSQENQTTPAIDMSENLSNTSSGSPEFFLATPPIPRLREKAIPSVNLTEKHTSPDDSSRSPIIKRPRTSLTPAPIKRLYFSTQEVRHENLEILTTSKKLLNSDVKSPDIIPVALDTKPIAVTSKKKFTFRTKSIPSSSSTETQSLFRSTPSVISSERSPSNSDSDSPDFLPVTPEMKQKPPSSSRRFTFRTKSAASSSSAPTLSEHHPLPAPITLSKRFSQHFSPTLEPQTQPLTQSQSKFGSSDVSNKFESSSDSDDNAFSFRPIIPGVAAAAAASSTNFSAQTKGFINSGRRKKLVKDKTKRKTGSNRFIIDEVDVAGNEGLTSGTEGSDSDLDAFDNSFVSPGTSPTITESQQVRYMKSTKVSPTRKLDQKKSLDQIALDGMDRIHTESSEYETDSFCVPNNCVEYETMGDFTQKMCEARIAIDQENPSSRLKKNLRSGTRLQESEGFKLPVNKPRRKRLIVYSDDSD